MCEFLKRHHRTPLASATARINCRLRRVCSLLREPASVATSPRLLTFPTFADAHARLDRFIRIQYVRTLDELNTEHDANVLAYVAGDLEPDDHERLESMFLLRHRDMLRKATVVTNVGERGWRT